MIYDTIRRTAEPSDASVRRFVRITFERMKPIPSTRTFPMSEARPFTLLLLFSLFCGTLFLPYAGAQVQYSIGNPSNEAQYMLELINRARANGGAEAARLGLSGLHEGPPTINGQSFPLANSVQPLSWNVKLFNAAQAHATNLNNNDQFFLGVSPHNFGGTDPGQRIAAAGYSMAPYNGPTTVSGFFPGPENVAEAETIGTGPYTGAKLIEAVLSAHEDLFTDQTVPGRGHRQTMMLSFWREIGIGIKVGTDFGQNMTWESLYIVQNFGTQTNSTPFVTGVVYRDTNGNGFYDPGEGVGGVRVDISGTGFFAVTPASGGYSVPVPGNGSYTATFSGGGVGVRQSQIVVTNGANAKLDYRPAAVANPTVLANISTRLRVQTGDNVLIGGFIVTGTQPKKVIVRAIGPSLPVLGKLANPTLELVGPGGTIATNDNWRSTQQAAILASSVPPTNDLESAIVANLPANSTGYTAIMRGAGGTTGVGLVEVYDLDRTVNSKLANISTRGFVQTGDNVMIGGFILVGSTPQKVIVRAIGPSLPVAGKLADPTLELFNGNGMSLGTNDNWRTGGQEAEIAASTVQPISDLESAFVVTLPAGGTTAIVRGKNGGTGVALVEVFTLN